MAEYNQDTNVASSDSIGLPRYLAAYRSQLPLIMAVPEAELLTVNVDIPSVITTLVGSLPEILALRSEVENRLPMFDVTKFDQLENVSFALAHTQGMYMSAVATPSDLRELVDLATKKRELVVSDATALINRGLIPAGSLDKLNGPNGYKNVAFDLVAVTQLLRAHWHAVEGKTAVSAKELDELTTLADQVITAVGLRDQGPRSTPEATLIRQKAFTLVVKTYDQVRRAVHYLRWEHGDAEKIAPSLYAGRRRKSSSKQGEESTPELPASDVSLQEEPLAVAPAEQGQFPGGSPFTDK